MSLLAPSWVRDGTNCYSVYIRLQQMVHNGALLHPLSVSVARGPSSVGDRRGRAFCTSTGCALSDWQGRSMVAPERSCGGSWSRERTGFGLIHHWIRVTKRRSWWAPMSPRPISPHARAKPNAHTSRLKMPP